MMVHCVWATPHWYYNLKNAKINVYIGYGSGGSESEAKQNALTDISGQMFTKIDSQTIQNKKSLNGEYKNDFEIKSSQKTKANLSDYEVVKLEYEDGQYFIAIEYENIPNLKRFIRKVNLLPNEGNITIQNDFLHNSFLGKSISSDLDKKIDFELNRENKSWILRYKNASQYIDENDLAKLFTTIPNEDLELHTNKKNDILYDGDKFYFQVKSKDDGYVSILSVYEDGTVSVLIKNVPVKKETRMVIPDENHNAEPTAGLLEAGKETFDMYVLIWNNKKILLDRFADGSNENIEDEKYKNFGELIEFLKDKKYATLKVVTKPR